MQPVRTYPIPGAAGDAFSVTYHRTKHGAHVFTATAPDGQGAAFTQFRDRHRRLSASERTRLAEFAARLAATDRAEG